MLYTKEFGRATRPSAYGDIKHENTTNVVQEQLCCTQDANCKFTEKLGKTLVKIKNFEPEY